jgi:hypothetical protein
MEMAAWTTFSWALKETSLARGRINKEVEKVDLTSTVWEVDSLLEVNAVYIVEVNSDKCQLLRQSTL